MDTITTTSTELKNADSPFTELLAMLQQTQDLSKICDSNVIQIIKQHIDNIMETLFQGLQCVAQMSGMLMKYNKRVTNEMIAGSYFVALMSNLAEALNALRMAFR